MSATARPKVYSLLAAITTAAILTGVAAARFPSTARASSAAIGPDAIPPSNPPQTAAEREAFPPGDKSPEAVVDAFDQMAFFDHDPVGAMKKYLSSDFVEHYPDLAPSGPGTDKQATIRFFETRGWKKGEQMRDQIFQVIADKDRVAVFHHTTRGPRDLGTAWVDIFRVQNGLIVEHWAVGQPVSPKISRRHSMF